MADDSLESYYLFFGGDTGNWIRSEKTVRSDQSTPRTGLLNYNKGHQEAATKTGAFNKNRFYLRFPTGDKPNRLSNARYCENLVQYSGLLFIYNEETKGLTSTYEASNIFPWSKIVMKKVDKMNKGGCTTQREKKSSLLVIF